MTNPITPIRPGKPESTDQRTWPEFGLMILILLAVLGLVLLSLAVTWVRLEDLRDRRERASNVALTIYVATPAPAGELPVPQPEGAAPPVATLSEEQLEQAGLRAASEALADARRTAEDAEDAMNELQLLLSFLEGAAVLVGLALGAAAYVGLRNAQDTRRELREEMADLKSLRADIERHRHELENLPGSLARIDTSAARIDKELQWIEPVFIGLLQANNELSLRNFDEAHNAAMRVLAIDENNAQALYIAGWLELQYIRHVPLESGLAKLERAQKEAPNWPSAIAAYGVALRRQASHMPPGDERDAVLAQAVANLRRALGMNKNLLDLNLESLWGTLAGMYRDSGDFSEAIKSYERACDITPGSSYPHGNLAALYLREGRDDPSSPMRAKALETFKKTRQRAYGELSLIPNDYFHVMDVAMSCTVLAHYPPPSDDRPHNYQAEGVDYFDNALKLAQSLEMLRVSRRGWTNLRDYCPPDWPDLRASLQQALDQVERTLQQMEAADRTQQGTTADA